jgi:hypothetical protein
VRFVSWDRKEGIEPDKLVLLILRNLRLVSLAIAGWSGPVRFGSLWNTRVSRYGSWPTEGGIWAEKFVIRGDELKIAREITRSVFSSHSMPYQPQQPVFGSHEDKRYGLLRSFFIWSNAFLSCGLHSSDTALDNNIRSNKDKCSIMVAIFK